MSRRTNVAIKCREPGWYALKYAPHGPQRQVRTTPARLAIASLICRFAVRTRFARPERNDRCEPVAARPDQHDQHQGSYRLVHPASKLALQPEVAARGGSRCGPRHTPSRRSSPCPGKQPSKPSGRGCSICWVSHSWSHQHAGIAYLLSLKSWPRWE